MGLALDHRVRGVHAEPHVALGVLVLNARNPILPAEGLWRVNRAGDSADPESSTVDVRRSHQSSGRRVTGDSQHSTVLDASLAQKAAKI